MEVKLDPDRLLQPKAGRNSGRTFDALVKAVLATREYATVVFRVSSRGEAKRLEPDVRLICEHFGLAIKSVRCRTDFEIGDGALLVWDGGVGGRGCRGHFIYDHSCREELSSSQFRDVMLSDEPAHAGEWPPFGV